MSESPAVQRPWINISISPSAEAAAIGFDEYAMNRIVVRLAEFMLFRDYNVVFGHDWREDGVMRAVAELAETAASGGRLSDLHDDTMRMLNLVPESPERLNKNALATAAASGNILGVYPLDKLEDCAVREKLFTAPDAAYIGKLMANLCTLKSLDRIAQLWVLRYALTRLYPIGCRICIGGRTEDYGGCYAGIAEEAYMALRHEQPLYLIGGFGGAAGVVAGALMNHPVAVSHLCLKPSPVMEQGTSTPSERQRIADDVKLPLCGLAPWLQDHGLTGLARCNGLSAEQNMQLFECTDVEEALGIIAKGLQALGLDSRRQAAIP